MRTIRLPTAFKVHDANLVFPFGLFAILLVAAVLAGPRLLTHDGLAGAIIVIAPLMLAALALTPIAIVGHGIDLSVGPLLGFLNVTIVKWLTEYGTSSPLVIFAYAVGAAVAYQLLQAAVIIYVRPPPLIVSLASFLVLSGLNLEIMDRPSGVAPEWMSQWGGGTEIVTPILLILVAAFLCWRTATKMAFFGQIRMTGADIKTAFASGTPVDAVRLAAHGLSGVFIGLAAIAYTALIGSGDPNQGSAYTLSAATALVLGGTSLSGGRGSGAGSALGAVNMYLITYVLAAFSFGMVSGFVTQAFFGLLLVLALLVNGLFLGRARR